MVRIAVKIKFQSHVSHCLSGDFCNALMPFVHIRICQKIIEGCAQIHNFAGRHGIREPLVFVVVPDGQKIRIKASNRSFSCIHRNKSPFTYPYHGQTGRRGQNRVCALLICELRIIPADIIMPENTETEKYGNDVSAVIFP